MEEKSQEFALIDKILNAQNAITDASDTILGVGLKKDAKKSSSASLKDITDEIPSWLYNMGQISSMIEIIFSLLSFFL